VQTGQVVQASLGYYINPLFSVLLGVLVLGERLRPAQWVAVALAAAGVAWLTWHAGQVPWLALVLAFSFGDLRADAQDRGAGPLEGLALETLLLAPLALPLLLWWTLTHDSALAQGAPPPWAGWPAERAAHRRATAAVCRRRAPPATGHRGHGAVRVAQHSADAGRVGVRRGL
jgi:chloramphenicol-sensitive protein RarD